jgi:hypothetical protein
MRAPLSCMSWRQLAGFALCLAAGSAIAPVCRAQCPTVPNNFATTSAYLAVLGRDPDPGGWIYWRGTVASGANTQLDVYNFFLIGPEYATRYGTPDAAQFLTILYQDALLREPDAGGYAFWLGALTEGTLTEPQIVACFIYGGEYASNANGAYASTYQTAPVTTTGMSQSGNGQIGTSIQTISIGYTNPLNTSTYSDIASGEVFIGPDPTASTTNGCYVQWFSNNTFVLYDGASSYTGTGGSASSLNGTYCSLVLYGGTGVVQNANGYTVTLALTYNAPMGGANGSVLTDPVWTDAMNNEGLATGWVNEGSVAVSQYDVSVTISGSPQALTWQAGPAYSTATFTVNYQALNGYTGTISFGVPSMQYGGYLYPSLSAYQVSGNGAITLTATYRTQYVGSNSGSFLGSFTASVSGGPQHTIWFQVNLVPTATFTISPVAPTSQSLGASGTASYQLLVPANGFLGAIVFTSAGVTGLPSGVSAYFGSVGTTQASVENSGAITLYLAAAPGTASGTYAPTISATSDPPSGYVTATATVALSVAGPAVISMPAPGAVLPGGSTTFAWTAAAGASDYQLLLGSSNGAGNYYSGSPTTATSATATIPSGNYTLVASLGTLTGSSWQWFYATYTVSTTTQNTIPVLTAGQQPIAVPRNNIPVQQILNFQPGQGDPRSIQACISDDTTFTVRILSATATTLTLSYAASTQNTAQLEPIGCTCPGGPIYPGPPPPEPEPPPPPSLGVTWNGAQVTSGGTVLLNADAGPNTVTLLVQNAEPGDTVTYSPIVLSFTQVLPPPPNDPGWTGLPEYPCSLQTVNAGYPAGPPAPVPADQTVTWTGVPPFGNNASIPWIFNGVQQPNFTFTVLGQTADFNSVVLPALQQVTVNGEPVWFAPNVAIHETAGNQFWHSPITDSTNWCWTRPDRGLTLPPPMINSPQMAGMPVYGYPGGYGLLQLDPPTYPADIWNWQQNISDWQTSLQGQAGPEVGSLNGTSSAAYPFWIRQVMQWQNYNCGQYPCASNNGAPVITNSKPVYWVQDPGQPSTGNPNPTNYSPNCNFLAPSLTASTVRDTGQPNTYWYGDPILMKMLGGAPAAYLSWNNIEESQGVTPFWDFEKANSVSEDIAYEFCTCSVLYSQSQATTSCQKAQ